MRSRRLLAASLLLIAVAVPLRGQEAPADPFDPDLSFSARLEALLERMRDRQESLDSLEAEFRQHKESMMFLEPSVSSGVFSFSAPDKVRWEYLEPDPISLLIADGEMTTWYRDLSRAERAGVSGHSQRILEYMGASTSLDKLLKYFTVALEVPKSSADPLELHLSPRFKRVEKRIRELQLTIDSTLYLPLRLRFVEGDGDITEYEFSNLRLNEEIPHERFVLDIPQDVELRTVDLGARSPQG